MLTHWTMNQQKLADTEGGYDIESDTKIISEKKGKFGEAIEANRLYAPDSESLFYNFVKDSNERLFYRLRYLRHNEVFLGSRTFYKGINNILKSFQ